MRLSVQTLLLAITVVFAVVYFVTTMDLPRASIAFPRLVLGALLISAFIGLFGKRDLLQLAKVKDWITGSKTPALAGLTAAYLLLYPLIGFGIASLVFLFASFIVFGVNPLLAGICSIGTVGVLLLVFVYGLQVAIG